MDIKGLGHNWTVTYPCQTYDHGSETIALPWFSHQRAGWSRTPNLDFHVVTTRTNQQFKGFACVCHQNDDDDVGWYHENPDEVPLLQHWVSLFSRRKKRAVFPGAVSAGKNSNFVWREMMLEIIHHDNLKVKNGRIYDCFTSHLNHYFVKKRRPHDGLAMISHDRPIRWASRFDWCWFCTTDLIKRIDLINV